MDPLEFSREVDRIAKYTDWSIFACLFLVELWVFLRLRFKVDNSGVLTLLLLLIVSIIRILRSSLDIQLQNLFVVSGIIVWISLYYFTFEM
jgi:hypothetical protein